MFCPKCGKDVGGSRFCPYCGTQMPEEKETVWSEGMACPHCGGKELAGDNCAFCGQRLVTEPTERFVGGGKVGHVPWGTYKGAMGCFLQLNEYGLVTKNYYRQETVIGYQDVTDVGFRSPTFCHFGWLSIRCRENSFLPFPTKYYSQVLRDKTTVLYQNKDTELFRGIFLALKMMTEKGT